jgi:hypothetical protein
MGYGSQSGSTGGGLSLPVSYEMVGVDERASCRTRRTLAHIFVSLLSLGAFDETSCLEILESCETKKPFPSRDLVRLDIFSLFSVWV